MRLHAPPGRGRGRTATAVTTALALAVTGLAAAAPAASAPDAPAATAALPADLPELRFDDPSIDWKQILVDGEDVEPEILLPLKAFTVGETPAPGEVG